MTSHPNRERSSAPSPIERLDFALIYATSLIVLGGCMMSMIRRVRGLTDCFRPQSGPTTDR
ncbi:MAG: hypothetical protein U0795_04795 [Pirellulales bacterium]